MSLLVSVMIPCYNHEKFIKDCFDSLIEQTYRAIEILLVDDASSDMSWEIINQYLPRLKRRFVDVYVSRNEKNCGITHNLNHMIQRAKGDIIKLIASDDFFDRSYFQNVVNAYLEYQPDFIMTNAFRVKEESSYTDPVIIDRFYNNDPFDADSNLNLFSRVFKGNFLCAPAVSLHRSVYDKYGLYDESLYVEDLDYWLNISKDKQLKLYYIDTPLVYYRQNANSISSKENNEYFEARLIRMFENSINTRVKYREYISKYKYNTYLLRLMFHFYILARKEKLYLLKKKCIEYRDIFDFPYRAMALLMR